MLSEPASVVDVSCSAVVLQTRRGATCAGCSLKTGCGQYLLAPQDESLSLSPTDLAGTVNADTLQPGAEVQLNLAPAQMLHLTFLFYLVPLLTLLLGTLAALLFGFDETGAILGAGAGLMLGLLVSRVALRRQGRVISLTRPDTSGRSGDSP